MPPRLACCGGEDMDEQEIFEAIERLSPMRRALIELAIISYEKGRDGIATALCGMARHKVRNRAELDDLAVLDLALLERLAVVVDERELIFWAVAIGEVYSGGDADLVNRLHRLIEARGSH